MHLKLVVYLLFLSVILTNVVVESIEPITMTIGAAAIGKQTIKSQLCYDIIQRFFVVETHFDMGMRL